MNRQSSKGEQVDPETILKLENFIKALSGTKRIHTDIYHARNLDYLINCRDSPSKQVRAMGVYVLSQYLLAKDNILDMVKEKKFLKMKHHIYLNNFDRFGDSLRKLALHHILKD